MSYFRSLPGLPKLLEQFTKDQRWLIVIDADPDAMASAMALKRIMSYRVSDVAIANINAIARPDNLAMIRYTRLRMVRFYYTLMRQFDHFAIVDSQPHHNQAFADIPFSVIIDHHPLPAQPFAAAYTDINPQYGATATLLTEYLYNLKIRPGKLLATALQYGIKTDTNNFQRHFYDIDIRVYQYLNRFAAPNLLSRISRSEYHLKWLEHFAKACTNLYGMRASGQYVYIGEVSNPDILVNIADFFMRVYEIRWAAVSGRYGDAVLVIFRGDGISKDVGDYAARSFGDIGSAGGHRTMARAEFSVKAAGSEDLELFIWQRLNSKSGRTRRARTAETRDGAKAALPMPFAADAARPEPMIDVDSEGIVIEGN